MPALTRVYPGIRYAGTIDMDVILQDLSSDSPSANELYQRLLDDGFTSNRAREICRHLTTLFDGDVRFCSRVMRRLMRAAHSRRCTRVRYRPLQIYSL